MRKTSSLLASGFLAVVLTAAAGGTVRAQEMNANNYMSIVQNGNYSTYVLVISNISNAAANKKIKPGDTDMINVVFYLGVLGSETKISSATASQDYAGIRQKCAIVLGEIGGNYARKCLVRMMYAEKDTASDKVVRACFIALSRMGNDDEYAALKAMQYVYRYMHKKETGDVIETLIAYVVCVEALAKTTPFPIMSNFGVMESLKELINEDSRYTIYSSFVRNRAKSALANILAGAM